jgi:hypothetical protein
MDSLDLGGCLRKIFIIFWNDLMLNPKLFQRNDHQLIKFRLKVLGC